MNGRWVEEFTKGSSVDNWGDEMRYNTIDDAFHE